MEQNSKHTQGERWYFLRQKRNNQFAIYAEQKYEHGNNPLVAMCPYDDRKFTGSPILQEEAEANAALICSSYVLLEEKNRLKEIVKKMYDLTEDMGMKLTSDYWNEEFRGRYNSVMTEAEFIIEKDNNINQ